MFGSRRGGTVIGDGLKIVGNVTAEGLVEVNGQIEGDLHCTSLTVSPKAQISYWHLADIDADSEHVRFWVKRTSLVRADVR